MRACLRAVAMAALTLGRSVMTATLPLLIAAVLTASMKSVATAVWTQGRSVMMATWWTVMDVIAAWLRPAAMGVWTQVRNVMMATPRMGTNVTAFAWTNTVAMVCLKPLKSAMMGMRFLVMAVTKDAKRRNVETCALIL